MASTRIILGWLLGVDNIVEEKCIYCIHSMNIIWVFCVDTMIILRAIAIELRTPNQIPKSELWSEVPLSKASTEPNFSEVISWYTD